MRFSEKWPLMNQYRTSFSLRTLHVKHKNDGCFWCNDTKNDVEKERNSGLRVNLQQSYLKSKSGHGWKGIRSKPNYKEVVSGAKGIGERKEAADFDDFSYRFQAILMRDFTRWSRMLMTNWHEPHEVKSHWSLVTPIWNQEQKAAFKDCFNWFMENLER